MKSFRLLSAAIILVVTVFSFSVSAEEIISNGGFDYGMSSWNVPDALYGWNPVEYNQASLHPVSGNYIGTVLYQNLNVTGFAGGKVSFSCLLSKLFSPSGKTIRFFLDYIDSSNARKTILLANPDNDSIAINTPVTASVTMPDDFSKLVRFGIAKDADGYFAVSAISLQTDNVITAMVPFIAGISSVSGSYDSSVSLVGTAFGDVKGTVSVGGETAGITVTSWNDNNVTFTVASPAKSGVVRIIAENVESDGVYAYNITSPGLLVKHVTPTQSVVQGTVVEYPVRVEFLNGYSLPAGMNFTVTGVGGGASPFTGASTPLLTPLPIKNSGGFSVRIDTKSLSAGNYPAELRSTSGPAFVLPFTLTVIKAASIKFYEYVYSPELTKRYIDKYEVKVQGEFYGPNAEVWDASGNIIVTDLVASSSDELILGAYKIYFYMYTLVAQNNGTANLIATAPDGTTASLPVTVTLPDAPKVNALQVFPGTITNLIPIDGTPINYSAQLVPPPGSFSYGPGATGYLNFDKWDYTYYPDTQSLSGTVKILNNTTIDNISQPPDPVITGVNVHVENDSGGATQTVPLRVVNDDSFGAIYGGVRPLGGSGMQMLSLDFCDTNGLNCVNKMSMGEQMSQNALSVMGGISPNRYKIKYSSWDSSLWYPNAGSAEQADIVTISAAGEDTGKYNLLLFHILPVVQIGIPVEGPGTVSSLQGGITCSEGKCSGIYTDGNWVTLHAEPQPGSMFLGWSGLCENSTSDCTVLASNALSVAAMFVSIPQQWLTTEINSVDGGYGSVMSDPAGIACPGTCSALFDFSTPATLMATADRFSYFNGWNGCDSVDPISNFCSVLMNSERKVSASFTMMKDVRVVNGADTVKGYFDTVSTSLPVSVNGDTIQLKASGGVVDQVMFSKPNASIKLFGGYNNDYSPGTEFSSITGSLTVQQGSIVANKIVIR